MKFSDDRIAHIAHKIRDSLSQGRLATYPDEDRALRDIKKTLIDYLKIEDESDEAARAKVASLKRGVVEGSREWDVLYRKYLNEEMAKRGRS
jgi:hypothetical protein